jgi:hypothetical protein
MMCLRSLGQERLADSFLLATWLEKMALILYDDQVVRRKGDENNFAVTWIIWNVFFLSVSTGEFQLLFNDCY